MKKMIAAALPLLLVSLSAQANTHFEQCIAKRHGYFDNCGLEDSDIPELIKYLQQYPSSPGENVDLSQNNITDAGLKQLVSHININNLVIDGNKITDASMPVLLNMFAVTLSNNAITDKGAMILAKSTALGSVGLANTKVTDKGANALGQNPNIQYVDLENDGITDQGVMGFSKQKYMGSLYLANNNISDAGAAALSHVQFEGGMLDLSHNNIGDKGAAALAENHTAATITYNHITDTGLQAFIDNSPKYYLNIPDMEGNQLTDRSVDAICQFQSAPSTSPASLSLGNNKITLNGIKKLIQCGQYKTINLVNSHYGDGVAELFGTTNFTNTDLSGNDITDDGIIALTKNHQWNILYLMDNKITDKGFSALMSIQHYDSLFLEGNKITDNAMNALLQSDNRIEWFGIGDNLVSEAMMEKLDGSKQVGQVEDLK